MKKQILIIIISIIIFVTLVLGIAYAYFAINKNLTNNVMANVSFQEGYTFTITHKNTSNETKDVAIGVDNEDMREQTSPLTSFESTSKTDGIVTNYSTDTIVVNVNNITNKNIICLYDYVWNWDSDSDNYYISNSDALEYTIEGPFAEKNVPNKNAESKKMGFDYITVGPNTSSSKEVDITTRHYNIYNVNQNDHKGKNYKGHLTFENIDCHENSTLVDYIISSESSNNSLVNDNGIRYVGQNPNNYILFNNQKYRIIGALNEHYFNSTTGLIETKLIKIVNNTSLGNMYIDKKVSVGSATDIYYSNNWQDSQLMMLLNTYDDKRVMDISVNAGNATTTVSYSKCTDDDTYICDSNNNKIYQNMGARFNTDTSVKIYAPSLADTNGYTPTTELNIPRIDSTNKNKMLIAAWRNFGIQKYASNDTHMTTAAKIYSLDRTNIRQTVYYDAMTVLWMGRVGLLSASDYGYATSGDTSGTGTNRKECLKYKMYYWNSTENNIKTSCADNSWLSYIDATASSAGTRTNTWTMDSLVISNSTTANQSESIDASYQYAIMQTGEIDAPGAQTVQYAVRDTFYLDPTLKIASGTGTFNDPFVLN